MFDTKTKFLVVDDFSTMRKVVKKALSEIGYSNVVEAADGQAALDLLKELSTTNEPVQFIISDWTMPRMAGIDLLRRCREAAEFKNLPFILVTAESEEKNIIEAAKAGVSDYVVKPFSAARIKEKIEQVYNKRSAEQVAR